MRSEDKIEPAAPRVAPRPPAAPGLEVRAAEAADWAGIERLRAALWPDYSPEDGGASTLPAAHFVAIVNGMVIGFIEVGLRSHADGCDGARPVGFLEGWYVEEAHRREGVGGQLVRAAEDWARAQGCTEMASDTWLTAEASQRAHEALGYEEVGRCVHYRKGL